MSQLNNNTAALQEILATVNALPEAGGSGGSVETCTMTLKIPNTTAPANIAASFYNETAQPCMQAITLSPFYDISHPIQNICKGSLFTLIIPNKTINMSSITITDECQIIYDNAFAGKFYCGIPFYITGDCTVEITL